MKYSTVVLVASFVVAAPLFASLTSRAFGGPQWPEFDAGIVKLSVPLEPGARLAINLGNIRNGTVTLTNTTLSECLQFAYSLVSDEQIAGPDWIKSRSDVRFDVVAKAPPDTPREQLLIMLQNLLADRLKLELHRVQKEQQALTIVVARNGAKLVPAKAGGDPPSLLPGLIKSSHLTMAQLATLLSRFERQLVIDLTDLPGDFDVDLHWAPESLRPRAPADGTPLLINGNAIDMNGPSLPTALQEQLGLQLESRKAPIEVLVVDHAERVPVNP